MKAIIFFFISYLSLTTLTFGSDKFNGVDRDKILHFSVSMSGQVTCAALATEVIEDKSTANVACAALILTAGGLAEIGAFGPNTTDKNDMLANTAGVGLGALIVQLKF